MPRRKNAKLKGRQGAIPAAKARTKKRPPKLVKTNVNEKSSNTATYGTLTQLSFDGRRIVSCRSLLAAFDAVTLHRGKCRDIIMNFEKEEISGIASTTTFVCKCGWKVFVKSDSGVAKCSLNDAFQWGCENTPVSFENAVSLLSCIDVPTSPNYFVQTDIISGDNQAMAISRQQTSTHRDKIIPCDENNAETGKDKCILCNKVTTNCGIQLEGLGRNEDYVVMFLLLKMLKVPGKKLQTLLPMYPNLRNWISSCDTCTLAIRSAFTIQKEIEELEKKLRKLQKQFQTSVHISSWKRPEAGNTILNGLKQPVSLQVRKYVATGHWDDVFPVCPSPAKPLQLLPDMCKQEPDDLDGDCLEHSASTKTPGFETTNDSNLDWDNVVVMPNVSLENLTPEPGPATCHNVENLNCSKPNYQYPARAHYTSIHLPEQCKQEPEEPMDFNEDSFADEDLFENSVPDISSAHGSSDTSHRVSPHEFIVPNVLPDDLLPSRIYHSHKFQQDLPQEENPLEDSFPDTKPIVSALDKSDSALNNTPTVPNVPESSEDLSQEPVSIAFYYGKVLNFSKPKSDRPLELTTKRPSWEDSLKYSCKMCPGIGSMRIHAFVQHILYHKRRPYKCKICGIYLSGSSLELDTLPDKLPSASLDPLLQGHKCSAESLEKVLFEIHSIWRCQHCFHCFNTPGLRDSHQDLCRNGSSVPEKPHKCSVCNKQFLTMSEWQIHRAVDHPEIALLSCLYCDDMFKTESNDLSHQYFLDGAALSGHLPECQRRTTGIHGNGSMPNLPECDFCGESFLIVESLHTHVEKAHFVSRNHAQSCQLCFARKSNWSRVQAHMKTHVKPAPNVCDICGYSVIDTKRFLDHCLQEHGMKSAKSEVHKCNFEGCSFETYVAENLSKHRKVIHNEARQHKCQFCGKGFLKVSQLHTHEAIHKNKLSRPYQCEICGNSFAVKNYLYIHMRLSHQNRPFASTHKKKKAPKSKKRVLGESQPTLLSTNNNVD